MAKRIIELPSVALKSSDFSKTSHTIKGYPHQPSLPGRGRRSWKHRFPTQRMCNANCGFVVAESHLVPWMFDIQTGFRWVACESQLILQQAVGFCIALPGCVFQTVQCFKQPKYLIQPIRILEACLYLHIDVFIQSPFKDTVKTSI